MLYFLSTILNYNKPFSYHIFHNKFFAFFNFEKINAKIIIKIIIISRKIFFYKIEDISFKFILLIWLYFLSSFLYKFIFSLKLFILSIYFLSVFSKICKIRWIIFEFLFWRILKKFFDKITWTIFYKI